MMNIDSLLYIDQRVYPAIVGITHSSELDI
jgi:hypothetical protein